MRTSDEQRDYVKRFVLDDVRGIKQEWGPVYGLGVLAEFLLDLLADFEELKNENMLAREYLALIATTVEARAATTWYGGATLLALSEALQIKDFLATPPAQEGGEANG